MQSKTKDNAIAERIKVEMDAIELMDLLSSAGATAETEDRDSEVVLTTDMLRGMAAEMTRTSYIPVPVQTRSALRYQVGIAALVAFALGLGAFVLVQNRALAEEGEPAAALVAEPVEQPVSPAIESNPSPVARIAEHEEPAPQIAEPSEDDWAAESASNPGSGRARAKHRADDAEPLEGRADEAMDDNPYDNAATEEPAVAPAPEPAPVATSEPESFEQRVDQMISSALEGPKKGGASQTAAETNTLPQSEQTVPQRPSRQDVRRSMNSLIGSIRACGGETYDRLVVKLTVDGTTGRVKSAQTVDSTYAGTAVGSCAARVARLAKFPRFAKNEIVVKYPFEL